MENVEWEQLIKNLIADGILHSQSVIRAMRLVSREPFLPDRLKSHSAVDSPLPIGWGQAASAPHDRVSWPCWAKHGFNHK